jgi:hypothetical protein
VLQCRPWGLRWEIVGISQIQTSPTVGHQPLVSVAVVVAGVLVLVGGLLDNRGLCRQDAQGPTPPTFSIVMRVRYPGGASGGGKLPPAPNIAVFSSSSSSGAPPSSPNRRSG